MNKALKIGIAVAAALAAVAGALLVIKKFFCKCNEEPVEVIEIDCSEDEPTPEQEDEPQAEPEDQPQDEEKTEE